MKRFLTFVLVFSMLFALLPSTSHATTPMVYKKISLEEFARTFSEDPDISNLNYQGNTLTFTMLKDINVQITDVSTSENVTIFRITENNQTQELLVDHLENKVSVDGKSLEFTIKEVPIYVMQENPILPQATTWIKMGNTQYTDIYAEVQIRNIYTTTLISIITLGASLKIGISALAANTIISVYSAANSTSKHTYVIRNLYYNEDLPWDHFLQKTDHYMNSNWTGYITTCNREYAGY